MPRKEKFVAPKRFKGQKTVAAPKLASSEMHVFMDGKVCLTDSRGYATPRNRSRTELVLDASEGFIPLWAKDMNLRWRFDESSLAYLEDPTGRKADIEGLLAEAILAWGDAAPISLSKRDDVWDFEITMKGGDTCSPRGCTLASGFLPDAGRHQLEIYPKLFTQSHQEQVETLIHEIGHIYGLRHFFANLSETDWPSVRFGKDEIFTIMNYGSNSRLTEDDKSDLKMLYQKVWGGELDSINGTRIVLIRPYHTA